MCIRDSWTGASVANIWSVVITYSPIVPKKHPVTATNPQYFLQIQFTNFKNVHIRIFHVPRELLCFSIIPSFLLFSPIENIFKPFHSSLLLLILYFSLPAIWNRGSATAFAGSSSFFYKFSNSPSFAMEWYFPVRPPAMTWSNTLIPKLLETVFFQVFRNLFILLCHHLFPFIYRIICMSIFQTIYFNFWNYLELCHVSIVLYILQI